MTTMIKRITTTVLFLLLVQMTMAQSANVSFNGLGRLYLTDNYLKGNLVDKDTVSPNRGTGGYILFDLGLNLQASDLLKVTAVMRARNEFGGFFGDGAALEFRQFKMSGFLGSNKKSIKYEIGDIDLKLTEYTLFNFQEIYNDYEADAFKARRSITSYENFNVGENWRVQGIHLNSGFEFDNLVKSAMLSGFVVRTKSSPSFQFPDRIILGGEVDLVQSNYFEVGANYIQLSDLSQTVQNSSYNYNNRVLTGDYKINYLADKINISLLGEAGTSTFSYSDKSLNDSNSFNDIFYDMKLKTVYKPLNLTATLSYRDVGANFRSVGAQTRRTLDYGTPSIFGQVDQSTTLRTPNEFDRYSQPEIYNRTISPVLMTYNPRYNLVAPYGRATPNRKGFTVTIATEDNKKYIKADVTVESLSEVIGEGTSAKRKFLSVRGGTLIDLGKIVNYKKRMSITFGGRYEKSTRDILVNMSSILADVGIEFEILRKVFLIGGYKYITSSGNEYISRYNDASQIGSYEDFSTTNKNITIDEGIVLAGMKYQFNLNTYFTVQANLSSNTNKDDITRNYTMNQLFFGYTMKF